MQEPAQDVMLRLRQALEASWDISTAYLSNAQPGNPAFAQCYPTARVVQHYFPETEIIEGNVWTGTSEEKHFWNGLRSGDDWIHIDLTWHQFPPGSTVRDFVVLDRKQLNDSAATSQRCATLLRRVEAFLCNLRPDRC